MRDYNSRDSAHDQVAEIRQSAIWRPISQMRFNPGWIDIAINRNNAGHAPGRSVCRFTRADIARFLMCSNRRAGFRGVRLCRKRSLPQGGCAFHRAAKGNHSWDSAGDAVEGNDGHHFLALPSTVHAECWGHLAVRWAVVPLVDLKIVSASAGPQRDCLTASLSSSKSVQLPSNGCGPCCWARAQVCEATVGTPQIH
jgi:hypothetical protein